MRLKAVIRIDLPSHLICEEQGSLARFFGLSKKSTNEERVLADTFTLVDQFITAFKVAGITNAIALRVDNKVIYKDTCQRENDIDRMISALDDNRYIIGEQFKLLEIAMECSENGIRYIFDTQVRGAVKIGKEEVDIAVSGMIEELEQQQGEKPQEYRARVKELMEDIHFLESYGIQYKLFLEDISQKLRIHLNALNGRIQYISSILRNTESDPYDYSIKNKRVRQRKSQTGQNSVQEFNNQVIRKILKDIPVKAGSIQSYSQEITVTKTINDMSKSVNIDISPLDFLDDLIIEIEE